MCVKLTWTGRCCTRGQSCSSDRSAPAARSSGVSDCCSGSGRTGGPCSPTSTSGWPGPPLCSVYPAERTCVKTTSPTLNTPVSLTADCSKAGFVLFHSSPFGCLPRLPQPYWQLVSWRTQLENSCSGFSPQTRVVLLYSGLSKPGRQTHTDRIKHLFSHITQLVIHHH